MEDGGFSLLRKPVLTGGTANESKIGSERFPKGRDNTRGLKEPEISGVCSVLEVPHLSVEPSIWEDNALKTFEGNWRQVLVK